MEIPEVVHLVPHAGPMSWLDVVVDHGDDWLEAEATIRPSTILGNDAEIGAWAGIEYMAQAIAALAGLRARARGESVRIGFLVGTRRYASGWSALPTGSHLHIRVALEYAEEGGLSVFGCVIRCQGETVAEAALTVFQPSNPATVLHEGHP
jgi:predicted hotdog family 3-hydroxylacyl-ACP dehydratase